MAVGVDSRGGAVDVAVNGTYWAGAIGGALLSIVLNPLVFAVLGRLRGPAGAPSAARPEH